jgi:hypothetical protein
MTFPFISPISFIIDILIISTIIYQVGSWGEWITATALYVPGAILAGGLFPLIGIGSETAMLLLWSPLVLLTVQVKIANRSPATPREYKKVTYLQIILGTFIVFTCMMLSIWMSLRVYTNRN